MSEPSILCSPHLRDLEAQFRVKGKGRPRDEFELEEVAADSTYREALEVLQYASSKFLYQSLTVWPDMLATFTIRETVQKRRWKVVFRVEHFFLGVPRPAVVDAFRWAGYQLRGLGEPPGKSEPDRALLAKIEARWLALSYAEAH